MSTCERRWREGWIRSVDVDESFGVLDRFRALRRDHPGAVRMLVDDAKPAAMLAVVFSAWEENAPALEVAVVSSRLTDSERAVVDATISPQVIWSSGEPCLRRAESDPGRGEERHPCARFLIPTGGTTSGLRFAVHTRATLEAAARGLQEWIGGGPIDSVCLLPLHHVSGLMQAVRCYTTGGQLTLVDWSAVSRGWLPELPKEGSSVTSLVPTQLARVLEWPEGAAWLRGFRCIFLGGAPAWPSLLMRARAGQIRLAPCYGMTETAAQVATLRPREFLEGLEGVGASLPHASVEIVDPSSGMPVDRGSEGRIVIRAQSLFLGYAGAEGACADGRLVTSDRGVVDAEGRLTVLGRLDAVINSGGEKIDPAEVEAAVRTLEGVQDAAVLGCPDERWGEVVVAVVVAVPRSIEAWREALRPLLAPHKIPKLFVARASLPRNEAGKLDRLVLQEIVRGENAGE